MKRARSTALNAAITRAEETARVSMRRLTMVSLEGSPWLPVLSSGVNPSSTAQHGSATHTATAQHSTSHHAHGVCGRPWKMLCEACLRTRAEGGGRALWCHSLAIQPTKDQCLLMSRMPVLACFWALQPACGGWAHSRQGLDHRALGAVR